MTPFDDILGQLATPPVGRNRRISSNEQPNWSDGNFDMTRIAPGAEFEMPVMEGPGVITHIWFTSHAGGVGELDALSLRIYYDGSAEPGVEVPVGQFFAVGQGRPAVVESVPVQVSPSGSLTCYWRMPFARSARIVVRNDNMDRGTGLYWQVDWQQLDALPPDTPYFYARYRQEHPAVMGRDYVLADLKGKGKYVGTVMSVTMAQDGWWGEGDDFFFIDGEEVPSLQGTGSEDYFNDAWGFRRRTGTWFGQPRWQGYSAGDAGVCYRWHVLDPVCFETSLLARIEHKGNRAESEDAWFIERPDFLSSVAFWYQTGTPAPWEPLPGWPERCVPWREQPVLEAYAALRASEGTRLKVDSTGLFGGRPALRWEGVKPGDTLAIPLEVAAAGRTAVRLMASPPDVPGGFEVLMNGEVVAGADAWRADEDGALDLLVGAPTLAAGTHTVTVRSVGGTEAVLERLRTLALPPEAVREVRGDNEAHFYRLGIGRATYAYRMINGRLPENLQEMVDAALLEPRYLHDENDYPFESWHDGEHLCVRSTGPEKWEYRWLGLDARR